MSNTAIIGLHPEELAWVRLVVSLLRHPDPTVPELTRQAILYLETSAAVGSPADRQVDRQVELAHSRREPLH